MAEFDFGGLAGTIGTGLLGGYFDNKAAKDINKANVQRDAANQQAALDREKRTTDLALNSNSDFSTSGVGADGTPFNTQVGGTNAAEARGTLAAGDRNIRAPNINALNDNFQFTLPTLGDARGVVDRDRALKQSSIIDPALKDLATLQSRKFGGLNNSGESAATMDALKQLYDSTKVGGETDAIDLFQKSQGQDTNNLRSQIAANQLQAPGPAFGANGNNAAALVAQTPLGLQNFTDVGGAINSLSGSNLVAQIKQQQQSQQDTERQQQLIRTLGDAFGSGGKAPHGSATL